ncbi:FG-GAP repeat domain-containing protein, partial [Limnospira fusiformis]|uniref:FG-GAP repeat domain-containing protein n=1 Tax=Limnospira fusiformis TaxID=54297 RepID=UPI002AA2200F|nr:VCBS repeat-containing protein [Limnospira fusiformis LS22]
MDNTQEVLDIWWLDSLESLNPLPALGFIGDVSVEPLTAAAEIQTALTKVNQQLTEFVASASFAADLQTAFGAYTDVELGKTIIEALGDGSQLPEMIVVSAELMNGVNGGFDSLTGTVYLSDAVINSEKLVDVVTEEFGHYLDSQLNEIDSPGDEGELFMRLVNGEVLSEADITLLKNQDDVVNILGGLVQVEASQDVSFSKATNFDVGSSPYAITVGDFNRNRKLDLAVANYSGSNVSLLLGKGDGTFDLSDTNLTVVNRPRLIAAGDLNADRNLDLVVMNQSTSSNNLTVLEGIGSAGFIGGNFNTGSKSGAGDFLLVDLDGDRNLDLIVMNQGNSDQISVLLGIGNGTFSNATNFNSGAYPYAIAVGDFNGNRKLDLAVASGSRGASVLLGDGNGGFGEATMFDTGGSARDIAVGDFNNDGNLDLVVTDHRSQAWMLPGRGDGTFGNAIGFPAGSSPKAMAVGDFNLDGNLDLAVVNSSFSWQDGQVSVLLGRGNGTFMSPVSFAVGRSPRDIAVGDFNGNGLDDLAVVNGGSSWSSGNVSILLNTTLSGSPIKPQITIRDTNVKEGDRGQTNARFVVTLDN